MNIKSIFALFPFFKDELVKVFLGLNVLRLWFCTLVAAGETKCKYSWRFSLGHLFKLLLMSWCRFSGRLGPLHGAYERAS